MGMVWKLAMGASLLGTEAAEAAEHSGGFGLNLDIFETNLINLAIVVTVLFYFGRNLLGKTLTDRRTTIKEAIQEAEQRKKEAAAALADQQQKLAQAQTEAEGIRASAAEAAKVARDEILARAQQEIQRMRETAAQDLSTEQDRIMRDLRQRIAALAIQRVENELPSRLTGDTPQQLVSRSISMLGGV